MGRCRLDVSLQHCLGTAGTTVKERRLYTLAVQDGELLAEVEGLECQLRASPKRCWSQTK